MYSLIHKQGLSQFLKEEGIPFIMSLALTELLYKFGSFILEASAFLATWYLLGAIINYVVVKRKPKY